MSPPPPRAPTARLRRLLLGCCALAPGACGESTTSATADPVPPATLAAPAAPAPSTVNAPPRNSIEAALAAAPLVDPSRVDAAGAADIPVEERSGTTFGGAFVVSWVPVPDPLPFNAPFALKVTVARAATPQVPDREARLELDTSMPAHGHGMNRTPRVTANGDGTFLVEGMLFHMSGRWDLLLQVHSGRDYGQAILHIDLP